MNGSRRLRLTDDQRRRLAVKGHVLGRRHLAAVAGIVTPDTILRWYRRLVAKKYDSSQTRRPGRPATKPDIAALVVRMAKENPTRGYTRIRGGLKQCTKPSISVRTADSGAVPPGAPVRAWRRRRAARRADSRPSRAGSAGTPPSSHSRRAHEESTPAIGPAGDDERACAVRRVHTAASARSSHTHTRRRTSGWPRRSGIARPMRRMSKKIPIAASKRPSRWCFGSLGNSGVSGQETVTVESAGQQII
jgi:hypothetical protein